MVKITERDMAIIAGLAGVTDFLTEGRLSAPFARAIKKQFTKGVPRVAVTAARGAKFVALRHPVLTGGAIAYYAYKNREEIGDLVEQGYEIIQPAVQTVQETIRPFMQQAAQATTAAYPQGPGIQSPRFLDPIRERITGVKTPRTAPRRRSQFNIAVGKGMRAVKRSTKYGGKGKISPAKKVFAMVTKLASAKKKKRKAPKSGIRRTIWNALGRLR